jgi:hypothetical protein
MSNDFQAAAQRLADVLRQENEALRRLDFPSAIALLPPKEAALLNLTKHPGAAVLGHTLPSSLAALAQRIAGFATENKILLERAIAVQTRVVQIVARAAAPPPAQTRYGGHGVRSPSRRAAPVALSTRA